MTGPTNHPESFYIWDGVTEALSDRGYSDVANAINTKIVDDYGLNAGLTPLSELRIAPTQRLAGGIFAGNTLDTNFFQSTLTGSSTIVVANKLATLATGTTANSTGRVETIVTGQYISSNSNFYRGLIVLGDTGAANNVRKWGATVTTDGYFFYLNGTEFGIGVRKNGNETLIPQGSFNKDTSFVLDTKIHIYEIYYKISKAYFTIDSKLVHEITIDDAPLVAEFNLKPSISNVNSNGLTTNHSISTALMTINRFGALTTNPFYKNLVGAGTFLLKQSSGRLHSIVCNNASTATGQLITIYDNTSAAGTKIGTLDLSKLPSPTVIQYNSSGVAFNNGLTLVIVGSTVDITVIYE